MAKEKKDPGVFEARTEREEKTSIEIEREGGD